MASVSMQRDLVIILKRETLLNVKLLSKIVPLTVDLSRQVFKENALEKLTQNVFNHLAHYLVAIIDSQAFAALSWPLYDSKTERTYRNELAAFISDCSSKGLLSPVMSSYLVNPACYKVTLLIFQMSQLAVQRALASKMDKEHQKHLYNEVSERYKSQNTQEFIQSIDKTTGIMLSKFSNYLSKKETMEKIADIMKKRIISMKQTIDELKPQDYIDNLVNNYLKGKHFDKEIETDIVAIKNVKKPAPFFDRWLLLVDERLDNLESTWENKTTLFLNLCKETVNNSKTLISRHTGEVDRKTFTLEFNPKTDVICTKDLESQVNSEQKYILKNIVQNDRLNFPNLIRGFLVSISVIMKNAEMGDEIYKFNEYLDGGCQSYGEVVMELRNVVERVMNAESRLQDIPQLYNESLSIRELMEIPQVPDLSDLKMTKDFPSHTVYDTYTPWNLRKHQFNLRTKALTNSFSKPVSKMFMTPFHHTTRSDVLSSRVSVYDQVNCTANFLNLSIMSTATSRGNETIADCGRPTSGFTKQQIQRLLSTRKSSSSKKHKFKTDRPMFRVKKGALFNESNSSNESINLIRSHSSPNLYENREKQSLKGRVRKLSIMKEDSPSLLEVSGIAALERDSNQCTPQNVTPMDSCRKLVDASNMPHISTGSVEKANSILSSTEIEKDGNEERISIVCEQSKILNVTEMESKASEKVDKLQSSIEFQKESPNVSKESKKTEKLPRVSWEEVEQSKENVFEMVTPKTNPIKQRTSSLEKIINRFKKVRASVYPSDLENIPKDINTINEEKENVYSIDMYTGTANRVLLPDLLSPSCNMLSTKCNDFIDNFDDDLDNRPRRPRESLGTALGVDNTFLDQFELID